MTEDCRSSHGINKRINDNFQSMFRPYASVKVLIAKLLAFFHFKFKLFLFSSVEIILFATDQT